MSMLDELLLLRVNWPVVATINPSQGDSSEIKVTDEFFLKLSLNVLYQALFRKTL